MNVAPTVTIPAQPRYLGETCYSYPGLLMTAERRLSPCDLARAFELQDAAMGKRIARAERGHGPDGEQEFIQLGQLLKRPS